MNTLKISSIRVSIQILFFTLLLTSSCSHSDKKSTSKSTTKTTKTATKPKVDINTAVLTGNLEAVNQHIKIGSDLNKKEPMSGSTPLMSAVTFNKPEIAKALINAKVDLSLKNNDGGTALHTAAFFGRIEIVQLLIDAKADKTIRNNFGATPREIVMVDFAQMKPIYEMLTMQLKPMGFTLDFAELKKARPVVAMMLQ